MLYSILLGNQNLLRDDFQIIKEKDDCFLEKKDIRQRIRISRVIGKPSIDLLYKTANTAVYDIGESKKWVNNVKSFNPILVPIKKKGEKNPSDNIVYLTVITDNYRLLHYTSNQRILQTYHGQNYRGCAIILPGVLNEDVELIAMEVLELKTNLFKKITITMSKEGKISTSKKNADKSRLDILKEKYEANKDKSSLGFKIHPKHGEFLTGLYLCSAKYADTVKHHTRKLHKAQDRVFVVIQNQSVNDDEYIMNALKDAINDSPYRSITVAGVSLKSKIAKKLRLLYVFTYDVKNNRITCKESS